MSPAISLAVLFAAALSAQLAPSNLRCEYMTGPMGVDTPHPRFYWVPRHAERGAQPAAYQIVVTNGAGEMVWDSGKVVSPESTHVAYAGKALESGKSYSWKVRYWDQAGRPSPYSSTAHFDTGLLAASDWKAKWIRGGNQARKEFTLDAKPVRARAYVAGIGYYELRINGRKVGNHVLDSPYTAYDKRILYSTYDVTDQLQAGANAAGVMLGEGWYAGRATLVQIEVEAEMPGGRKTIIASDATWKSTTGPILADSIYNGETYDARKETAGWDRSGFNDTGWEPVSLNDPPKGVLSSQMMPPIRVVGNLTPLKMTNPKPGVWIYDLGQNFSGWMRLRVRGPAGTVVKLRHAELLYDDGTLNVENLRSARATDVYILKGTGEDEVYEPHFTYHGFRYVELTGFPGTPQLDTLTGRIVHSDVKPSGGFSSSKAVLNQMQRIIVWGISSNLHSIPTDCNQRDERMGWMADAHLYAEAAMLNFDMPAFYSNFVRNMRDSQEADGSVPDTVPRARFAQGPADPAWGSAYPLIVLYMYERYGDRRILEENFEGIRRWAEFLRSKSENGIVSFSKFGDWVPLERTPGPLVSTFYYHWSADIVARVAEILGRTAEAAQYHQLAAEIKTAFHTRFYNSGLASYGTGTQTANILPLYLDMAPDEARGPASRYLRDDLVYHRNTHLATGILGTKYLFPLLSRTGNSDLAYDLATQTTYPSWGYMIERGATTLWELWQEKTGPSMNSHNHPMFGSIGAWMYESLAGINFDPKEPGYRRIRIEPQVVRDLNWVSGTINTVRGTVSSSWTRTGEVLRLEVTIPLGSTAEVHVPKLGLGNITVEESGRAVWKDGRFEGTGRETRGELIFEIGSGTYVFERKGS